MALNYHQEEGLKGKKETIVSFGVKCSTRVYCSRGELESYMELLVRNFNVSTIDKLMCRDIVSVGHEGTVYDCDFNQQLDISLKSRQGKGGGEIIYQ